MAELRTGRLLLRQWRDVDLEPFAELNADPETMRYFPAPPSREESDALAEEARRQIEDEGWGLWAVEVAGGPSFLGFVGLARPSFEEHFTPAVGWAIRCGRTCSTACRATPGRFLTPAFEAQWRRSGRRSGS